MKKDEVMIPAATWITLKILCQMEVIKDHILYGSVYIKYPEGKNIGIENGLVVA